MPKKPRTSASASTVGFSLSSAMRTLKSPAFYLKYSVDIIAYVAFVVTLGFMWAPTRDACAAFVTVQHNATDPDALKEGEYMRFVVGPLDALFVLYLLLICAVLYDTVREQLPKVLGGVSPGARDAFRHLVAQAVYAFVTTAFLIDLLAQFPGGVTGAGWFTAGDQGAMTMGTKILLLCDVAFWLFSLGLFLVRPVVGIRSKVPLIPVLVEAATHLGFALVAYLLSYPRLAVVAMLLGNLGEFADCTGVIYAAYTRPAPGTKQVKASKRSQPSGLGAIGAMFVSGDSGSLAARAVVVSTLAARIAVPLVLRTQLVVADEE